MWDSCKKHINYLLHFSKIIQEGIKIIANDTSIKNLTVGFVEQYDNQANFVVLIHVTLGPQSYSLRSAYLPSINSGPINKALAPKYVHLSSLFIQKLIGFWVKE